MSNLFEHAFRSFSEGKPVLILENNIGNTDDQYSAAAIAISPHATSKETIELCQSYTNSDPVILVSSKIADKIINNAKKSTQADNIEAIINNLDILTGHSEQRKYQELDLSCIDKASDHGTLSVAGYREAAIDMVRLCRNEHFVLTSATLNIEKINNLINTTKQQNIAALSVLDIKKYRMKNENILIKSQTSAMPTKFGNFNITVYKNKFTKAEHAVLHQGMEKAGGMVRIHSKCATGDTFCSLRCDCGQQLSFALKAINKAGNGALIYLENHEGRGIGLFNKINAYKIQEQGANTFEANLALGLPADNRDYSDGVMILRDMALDNFSLITNSHQKVSFLKSFGFNFKVKSKKPSPNKHNNKYLSEKYSTTLRWQH